METVIVGVLRTLTTGVLASFFVFALSRPKYGKTPMIILLIAVVLVDISSSIYFYLQNDLTTLARFDIFLFCFIGVVAKPLFSDTPMQWLFNYVTALNMYVANVIVSYLLSRLLPVPMVSNIILRVIIFSGILFLFIRFLRPLYRQVVERWSIFFFLAVAILANFAYYIFRDANIEAMFIENAPELLLIILTMVLVYFTIFATLRSLSKEYELREENARIQLQQALLSSELAAAQDFIRLAKQSRHDMRHHDAVLLEYLAQNKTENARSYLEQHERSTHSSAFRNFCENQTVNAIFNLYEQRCVNDGIKTTFQTNLPSQLSIPDPTLGVLFSNILENAWKACRTERSNNNEAGILCIAEVDDVGRLIVEARNDVSRTIRFENGIPLREDGDKGVGTQSVNDTVAQYKGMVRYSQQGNTFIAQVVFTLPVESESK